MEPEVPRLLVGTKQGTRVELYEESNLPLARIRSSGPEETEPRVRRKSSRRLDQSGRQRRRRSSTATSGRNAQEECVETRILPGFSKQLPNFISDGALWDKRHEAEMDFDKIDECSPVYCPTELLAAVLRPLMKAHFHVLELGCGLTPMSPWIKTHLHAQLVLCTDASAYAVHILGQKFGKLDPPVEFARLDVRSLKTSLQELAACKDRADDLFFSWDVIVSKGLVDCICTTPQSVKTLRRYFRTVRSILRAGGVYMFVTNVPPRLRTAYLDLSQWASEVYPIQETTAHAVVCTAI